MEDGLNISQGINEGAAQVFKQPDLSFLDKQIAEQQREKAANQAAQQRRAADMNKGINSLHNIDTFFRDQPYFATKQKELYDWAKDNANKIVKEGDPMATIELQRKVADLQNDVNLSKNAREHYESVGKKVLGEGGMQNYLPGANEYHDSFIKELTPEEIASGKKPDWNYDESKFQKETPLYSIIKNAKSAKPEVAHKTGSGTIDPVTGQAYNWETKSYTPEEAQQLIDVTTLQNPVERESLHAQLQRSSDETKKKYIDENGKVNLRQYAYDVLSPSLVINPETVGKVSSKGGGGYTKEQAENAAETTQVFNAGKDDKGNTRTVKAIGNYSFTKPLTVTIQIPQGTINANNFSMETKTGVDKTVSLGAMQIYPVYKGSTSIVYEQDMDELNRAGRLNSIEYKIFVAASADDKNADNETIQKGYLLPLDAVRTTLETSKDKVPVKELEEAARKNTDALHGGVKEQAKTTTTKAPPKKGDKMNYKGSEYEFVGGNPADMKNWKKK